MYLYHYSASQLKELLTKRKQGHLSSEQIKESTKKAEEMQDPGPYVDHISLFIEPIPYKTLPDIFHNKHPFWMKDKVIYEHVIDTNDLPSDLIWSIVETPEMDKYTDQFDWENATKEERISYIVKMNKEMLRSGYTGKGIFGLQNKIKKYIGQTEKFYKEARKRPDADDTKNQYAACVPHLMVYPKDGTIKIHQINKVILGKGIISENDPLQNW